VVAAFDTDTRGFAEPNPVNLSRLQCQRTLPTSQWDRIDLDQCNRAGDCLIE
jgi:hypothetical protein